MISLIKRQLKIPFVIISTLATFFSIKSIGRYVKYIRSNKITRHAFQFLRLSTKSDPLYKLKLMLVCLLIFINQIPLATIQLTTIFEQMGKSISSEHKLVNIIDDIYEQDIISEEDHTYLTTLRKQRNFFIHESEVAFDKSNSLDTLFKSTLAFEKIQSHLKNNEPIQEEKVVDEIVA